MQIWDSTFLANQVSGVFSTHCRFMPSSKLRSSVSKNEPRRTLRPCTRACVCQHWFCQGEQWNGEDTRRVLKNSSSNTVHHNNTDTTATAWVSTQLTWVGAKLAPPGSPSDAVDLRPEGASCHCGYRSLPYTQTHKLAIGDHEVGSCHKFMEHEIRSDLFWCRKKINKIHAHVKGFQKTSGKVYTLKKKKDWIYIFCTKIKINLPGKLHFFAN